VRINLNSDFDISDKERSGYLVAVKENKLRKDEKSAKRWKILRLIYIVSIFLIYRFIS